MTSENKSLRQIVVIAGPTGSGKNAIIDALKERFPKCSRLVTATTRAPRPGEVEGVDYYFFSNERFEKELAEGNILEHRFIESLGTHYGIYKPDLDMRIREGHVVLGHVDVIGARFLKQHYSAVTFFILPDSMENLKKRVRGRSQSMSPDELEKRILVAEREVAEHAPEYDYRIVNPEGRLFEAVEHIVEILKKEGYTLES